MPMIWGDGTNSSVGPQINTEYYHKKALIEAVREQYFQPLADVTAMPKHYGKKIKLYHMLPLLDDRNVNDQGIDASGATITDGNLYGSSKDIGTITDRLPVLSETGGRVNRVGYTRQLVEGVLEDMGFFHELTREALDFDTMDDLYEHYSRELVRGASELTEDTLQIDLLNGAGVVLFGGEAVSDATMTGEDGATPSVVDYRLLQKLSLILDQNRTPKTTKILVGSQMNKTVPVGAGRILYCGSELEIQLEKITDAFGNKAFVPVEQYAYANDYKKGVNMLHGEIGKIGQFRIVVHPEMANWSGAGADVSTNGGYSETDGKYDIFPMLCVGSESFTTIGFQTGGKTHKFKIITKMPSAETAHSISDPYGRTGFTSIQWYYGTMILRPERIGLIKTIAEA